jgi:hypothetical protein
MGTISNTNIDDLLEETMEFAEDEISFKLNLIEIDSLLEDTRHW